MSNVGHIFLALPFLSADSPCFRDGTRRVPVTVKQPALENVTAIFFLTPGRSAGLGSPAVSSLRGGSETAPPQRTVRPFIHPVGSKAKGVACGSSTAFLYYTRMRMGKARKRANDFAQSFRILRTTHRWQKCCFTLAARNFRPKCPFCDFFLFFAYREDATGR